jgi:histidine triad (HIT) family protein
MHSDCLFCKIGNGAIPADKLYEDDELLAFWDINPQAPKHFLVIPKQHISGPGAVTAAEAGLIGNLIARAGELARQHGIGDGYRLVLNNGAQAGQTVYHLHLHVLGGRALGWPPG